MDPKHESDELGKFSSNPDGSCQSSNIQDEGAGENPKQLYTYSKKQNTGVENRSREAEKTHSCRNQQNTEAQRNSNNNIENETLQRNEQIMCSSESKSKINEEYSERHCTTEADLKSNIDTELGEKVNHSSEKSSEQSKDCFNKTRKDDEPPSPVCDGTNDRLHDLKFIELDQKLGIPRVVLGKWKKGAQEKIILLIGASGSGKSTIVKLFYNLSLGVEAPDQTLFRNLPVNKKREFPSQIIAYTFSSEEEDTIAITIIDTPGLNDSAGEGIQSHAEALKFILKQISHNKCEIHAIGFVAQSHLSRLTVSEKFVMDCISQYSNISGNLITFITFSDNQKTPPVIKAMQEYGLDITHYFTFNNSVLCCEEDEEVTSLDGRNWRKGIQNWKKIKKLIEKMVPVQFNFKQDESCQESNKLDESCNESNKSVTGAIVKTVKQDVSTVNMPTSQHTSPNPVEQLNSAIRHFILVVDRKENFSKVDNFRNLVWKYAGDAYIFVSCESYCNIQMFLFHFVADICQVDRPQLEPYVYVCILSLSRERPLMNTANGIIMGLWPVYIKVKNCAWYSCFRMDVLEILVMAKKRISCLLYTHGWHEFFPVELFLMYLYREVGDEHKKFVADIGKVK